MRRTICVNVTDILERLFYIENDAYFQLFSYRLALRKLTHLSTMLFHWNPIVVLHFYQIQSFYFALEHYNHRHKMIINKTMDDDDDDDDSTDDDRHDR